MQVEVNIVSAFVDSPDGGNKAGVILNADDFSSAQKLLIAGKVGLSETAFVSSSDIADIKLEFFTPTRQIAHCGHATIATFSYLAHLGSLNNAQSSKETIDGIREVQLRKNFAYMQQTAPEYVDVNLYRVKIARALAVSEEMFIAEPSLVNTGNSFVIVGFKDKETLARITPDQRLIEEISESLDLIGFYVFSLETYTPGADASARMFAPRFGIPEESATGMAAGPLACYLYQKMGNKKQHFEIEQGYAMVPTSPSRIYVELLLDDQSIKSVLAGGKGKLVELLQISV